MDGLQRTVVVVPQLEERIRGVEVVFALFDFHLHVLAPIVLT